MGNILQFLDVEGITDSGDEEESESEEEPEGMGLPYLLYIWLLILSVGFLDDDDDVPGVHEGQFASWLFLQPPVASAKAKAKELEELAARVRAKTRINLPVRGLVDAEGQPHNIATFRHASQQSSVSLYKVAVKVRCRPLPTQFFYPSLSFCVAWP